LTSSLDSLEVVRVDQFGESASVTLSSGLAQVTVFCWPCRLQPGEHVHNALSGDGALVAACLDDWPAALKAERSVQQLEAWVGGGHNDWSWRGCGRLVDPDQGIVDVLGFKIECAGVDLPAGTTVEFECERVSLRVFD